jgi:photosystem II stability/assembly factor-like uncharacterized protein
MKTTNSCILILLMLVLFPFALEAQWILKYNSSTPFRRILVQDQSLVYSIGDNGTLLKTINGGTSWETLQTGTTKRLFDIDFPIPATGYCSGADGLLLKTIDGGTTWIPLMTGTALQIRGISFLTPDAGFLAGSNAIDPLSFGGDQGIILRTTDGGVSFNQVYSGNEAIQDIQMVSPTHGYAVCNGPFGSSARIVRTTDGGSTWQDSYVATDMVQFTTIEAFHDGLVYAACYTDLLATSSDFGSTWTITHPFTQSSVIDMSFPSASTGYNAGWEPMSSSVAINKTTDEGISWTQQKTGLFTCIGFADDSVGYAGTEDGKLYKTTNGGVLVGIPQTDDISSKRFTLFPNPVSTLLHARLLENSSCKSTGWWMQVYSATGELVIETTSSRNTTSSINMTTFPNGIYFVVVRGEESVLFSGKVMKTE